MSESIKGKRSTQDVVEQARRMAQQRGAARSEEAPAASTAESFAALAQSNPIARVMVNGALTPEAKRDELAKLLQFSVESTKEENRAKLAALEQFKEFLQEQRKVLNREGIKLQDTEAFAELQSVIDEMTNASVEFQDRIKPLLEVLNAVFEIRKQDKVEDVYREIQSDVAWKNEKLEQLRALEAEFGASQDDVRALQEERAQLLEKKTFFGLGPVKESARMRVSEIDNVALVSAGKKVSQLVQEIAALKQTIDSGPDTSNPELAKQKGVLREFLDLTKDENRQRQKALIDAAVHYVDTSDKRLTSVMSTLGRLQKHAEVVGDANSMLRTMHVIMDEGVKQAAGEHAALKEKLAQGAGDESAIAKMTREEKLRELNEHMTLTNESAVDIANSIGGLAKHSVQIQAYSDTLRNESSSTKRLHLEGVSQMGEQLMSVISAISAAATSESRALAANNFQKMAEQNQTIVAQEVVRNATNIELEANHISRLVGELEDYGAVLSSSNEIAQQGYTRMKETVDAIRKVSGSVQEAIKDLVSDRADADFASSRQSSEPEPVQRAANDAVTPTDNPFDKLRS